MADIPLTLIKLSALTGMCLVWANFTVKAFKLGWHIAKFSLEKQEEEDDDEDEEFYEEITCEDCQKRFSDAVSKLRQTCSSCKFCLEKSIQKINSKNNPRVMCEECQAYFIDNGDEIDDEKLLCEDCRERN